MDRGRHGGGGHAPLLALLGLLEFLLRALHAARRVDGWPHWRRRAEVPGDDRAPAGATADRSTRGNLHAMDVEEC